MLTPLKKYGFPLLIIIAIGAFLFLNHNTDVDKAATEKKLRTEELNESEEHKTVPEEDIVVDVKGEVTEPGVYKVDSNDRVNDVINMAGGFTEEAEESMVNLAERVRDEMVVEVLPNSENTPESDDYQEESSQLRINEASQEEIEELNGIGPAKAEAIIEYREEEGYFKTADDILNVSGIGKKTLESLEEYIKIP